MNDKDNPYTHDPDKPFAWIRGHQVGGKSIMWARLSYRLSDIDFKANAKDGFGTDWPFRYKDLAPWYDYVETFAGISGQAEGLPQLPDGKFLPPMELNCVEKSMRERLQKSISDRVLTIGRCAVLTQPHNGRAPCHYCGPCHRGCSTGSYFSSLSATLPAAAATGNLTLRPNSVVHSVIYYDDKDKAVGVRVIDGETKEMIEFYGRMIFLCASTLGSTRILLNSKSKRFPNGLANSSGALGHYLMDHHYRVYAEGEFEGFGNQYYSGYRPNGFYIPRFRNINNQHPDFLRGYALQGAAFREGWDRGSITPGFGAEFKRQISKPGKWKVRTNAFGECLPNYDNYVELDPDVKDAWGLPVLKIHFQWGENEAAMRKDMRIASAETLEASGAKNIVIDEKPSIPGLCIHEMGTARMGHDPKTSVLNGYNQAHDVPNLFVTDGASMPSVACQNPSLTFMALTARACDYAVSEMKKMHI